MVQHVAVPVRIDLSEFVCYAIVFAEPHRVHRQQPNLMKYSFQNVNIISIQNQVRDTWNLPVHWLEHLQKGNSQRYSPDDRVCNPSVYWV